MMTFEQRPRGGESNMAVSGKSILGRENSKCKVFLREEHGMFRNV